MKWCHSNQQLLQCQGNCGGRGRWDRQECLCMSEGRIGTRCSNGDDNDGSFFRPSLGSSSHFYFLSILLSLNWPGTITNGISRTWLGRQQNRGIMGSSYIRAKVSGIQPENHGFLAVPAKSNRSNLLQFWSVVALTRIMRIKCYNIPT